MPAAPDQPLPPYSPLSPAAPVAVNAAYSPLSPDEPEQPTSQVVYATVTGTLTSDGSTPETFSNLDFAGVLFDRPSFGSGSDGIASDGDVWALSSSTASWTSTADVETPDRVPPGAWHTTTNPNAWKPTAPATGTPVVNLTGFVPVSMPPPPNTIASP